jgi:pilus assembly protein CpaE
MHISVLAGIDRQLPDILRTCGAQVTPIELDDLKALADPAAQQPDVIVVDARDRAMPAELGVIKREHPATGILAVLPRLEGTLILDAMRAGASECVTNPLTRDDVNAALARIAAQRPAPRRGHLFAVIGAKGGVGATTVAVNVATKLNTLHPSCTLLVDLHMTYGDAQIFLGAEPRFSVLDALENMHRMDASFLRTLVTHTKSGLHVLASSAHAVTSPVDVSRVRSLIDLAAKEFRFVVLDVPRTDAVMLDALESVSSVIVVANQDVAAIRSAARMTAALEQRYGKERVSVVISRYDTSAEIGEADVARVIGRPVTCLFPNNYQTALASLNNGRPLVLDTHTKLASAFATFAGSLAGVPAERRERPKSTGLLSLIGGRR